MRCGYGWTTKVKLLCGTMMVDGELFMLFYDFTPNNSYNSGSLRRAIDLLTRARPIDPSPIVVSRREGAKVVIVRSSSSSLIKIYGNLYDTREFPESFALSFDEHIGTLTHSLSLSHSDQNGFNITGHFEEEKTYNIH